MPGVDQRPSRRRFLSHALALGGLAAPSDSYLARLWAQAGCDDEPAGTLVRLIPLYGAGAQDVPLGEMVGGPGLDARQFTEL